MVITDKKIVVTTPGIYSQRIYTAFHNTGLKDIVSAPVIVTRPVVDKHVYNVLFNELSSFDVSRTPTASNGAVNDTLEQFTVSDSDPSMEEIPPMDGLDVTPDEETATEPEDAGLGADDAVMAEDVQDQAPVQDEAIAA